MPWWQGTQLKRGNFLTSLAIISLRTLLLGVNGNFRMEQFGPLYSNALIKHVKLLSNLCDELARHFFYAVIQNTKFHILTAVRKVEIGTRLTATATSPTSLCDVCYKQSHTGPLYWSAQMSYPGSELLPFH